MTSEGDGRLPFLCELADLPSSFFNALRFDIVAASVKKRGEKRGRFPYSSIPEFQVPANQAARGTFGAKFPLARTLTVTSTS